MRSCSKKMAAALARTEPGQKYVDISVPDTAGMELPLSRFVGEGKYVLLDFWASWCPPCRAEIPNLVTAYKEFHSKGFEIYAVSLDKNRKAWLDGIKMFKMDWPQVGTLKFWESAAAETYGVRSIPSNVLIGPDGTILARNLMGSVLLQKLGNCWCRSLQKRCRFRKLRPCELMRESVPRIEMNVPDFRGFHKFLRKKFVRNNFFCLSLHSQRERLRSLTE